LSFSCIRTLVPSSIPAPPDVRGVELYRGEAVPRVRQANVDVLANPAERFSLELLFAVLTFHAFTCWSNLVAPRPNGRPGAVAVSGEDRRAVSTSGWETRLYWRWILYNSLAFIALLTAVSVLVWLTADVLNLAVANRSMISALLVATFGALLFGTVLGSLQWLVVRERLPIPRRQWIVANVGPALVGWLLVIMPAVIQAQNTDADVGLAYMLAVSQTLALGPLLGLSQSLVLRKYTGRWGLVDRCQPRVLADRRSPGRPRAALQSV
jgi:hypothetical protein